MKKLPKIIKNFLVIPLAVYSFIALVSCIYLGQLDKAMIWAISFLGFSGWAVSTATIILLMKGLDNYKNYYKNNKQ